MKDQVQLSQDICLFSITQNDQAELFQLMIRIYPEAYAHLWKDEGGWYVKEHFSIRTLEKELSESGAAYYFIRYKNTQVGILRFVLQKSLKEFPALKVMKLHRIYLGKEAQGKGLGSVILEYLEQIAKENQLDAIWLEAMDSQKQAFSFYKSKGFEVINTLELTFDLMHPKWRGMYRMLHRIS